jgi:hypothetical protein
MSLYPNPAIDQVTCSVYYPENYNTLIEIRNYLGQKVYAESIDFKEGPNTFTLDLRKFNKGIYYVTLKSSNGKIVMTKQLMVQ